MATVTESLDDLVREAETLKSRLEEERARFNDMECMFKKKFFSLIYLLTLSSSSSSSLFLN